MLNSSVLTKAPPCGLSAEGDQIPCEWSVLWTLTAAVVSFLVFCIIQAILFLINDPGRKKLKPTSQVITNVYEPVSGAIQVIEVEGNHTNDQPQNPTCLLPQVTEESETEEDLVLNKALSHEVDVGSSDRKLPSGPAIGIGMQHDLLPVEEEANEVPEMEDGAPPAPPTTPSTSTVSPPPLSHLQISANYHRSRAQSMTGTHSSKAEPSIDRLSSPRYSAATVTIALLKEPANRREANQLWNTTTITAMTGPRHLKELQRNIRRTTQTDIFLNSMLHRRSGSSTPDRHTGHQSSISHPHLSPSGPPLGRHLSAGSPNGPLGAEPSVTPLSKQPWHQSAASGLQTQNTAHGNSTISVDDSSVPAANQFSRKSLQSTGATAHTDDNSGHSRTPASDIQQSINRRSNTGFSRFPQARLLARKRTISHEAATNNPPSEAIEMKKVAPKKNFNDA